HIDKTHPGCTYDLMTVRIREGRFDDVAQLRQQAFKDGLHYPWLEEPSGYAALAKGNTEEALAHFQRMAISGREMGSSVFFRASQEGVAEVALYEGKVDDACRQLFAALQ